MKRAPLILLVLATLAVAAGCTVNVPIFGMHDELKKIIIDRSDSTFEFNSIALVNVDGYIGQIDGSGVRAVSTSVADIKQKLRLAEKDSNVKAVLLRINSPGGEVTASDMMYNEIRRFRRDTGKPVVAYITTVGASGGYYVALACDTIIAHPTSITGSVGVIMDFIDVEGLMKTFGVRHETVKSGNMKDMGSPFRGLNPKEKEALQEINKLMFGRFLGLVKKHRNMTEEAIATISDGRIVTGEQAKELGLVDAIGSLEQAIDFAKTMAGIATANVIAWRPFTHYNKNLYAGFASEAPKPEAVQDLVRALAGQTGPTFLYMWKPGR